MTMQWSITTLDTVLYGCDKEKLLNEAYVRDFLMESPSKVSMETCIEPILAKHKIGLVGMTGLMTSHLALVTIKSKESVYCILSTCKRFDTTKFVKYVSDKFHAKSAEYGCSEDIILPAILQKSGNLSSFAPKGLLYGAHGYYGCDASVLNDDTKIRKMLEVQATTKTNNSRVTVYKFKPQGITAALTNPKYCIFVHTWPELSFAEVDALSQSQRDLDRIDNFAKGVLVNATHS